MSPRIIHIPLSGGDRKAQAKGIRYAHGIHETHYRGSVLIRSAAEAKIREADRLECEAWNAIMWAGGPAMPSPGEPQAEPTIGKAINGGFDLLEAKCNRCDRVSLVPLRALRHPPETPVWKLEAALYCEPCSAGRHYKRLSHLGLAKLASHTLAPIVRPYSRPEIPDAWAALLESWRAYGGRGLMSAPTSPPIPILNKPADSTQRVFLLLLRGAASC